jgi:hypothetical protein
VPVDKNVNDAGKGVFNGQQAVGRGGASGDSFPVINLGWKKEKYCRPLSESKKNVLEKSLHRQKPVRNINHIFFIKADPS